jgi:tRNA A37 threonylcarbamoyladenosine modification protein TsaB
MILLIDSSGYDQLHFALIDGANIDDVNKDGKVIEEKIKITYPETQKTLGYLDKFLNKKKITLNQITKLIVVSGPGSFTGIRVGISMSLAFSFAKDIPLYSISKDKLPKNLSELAKIRLKKIDSSFDPEYGAEPNITLKKN